MAETIICLVICALVALVMTGIGISQLRSKEPVGFYSGEKPPKAEDIIDVKAWNKGHGKMWVAYGIIIFITSFLGLLAGDSAWVTVPTLAGFLLPLFFMIRYHKKLQEKYLKKK